jgi:hypothetical protein
MSKQNKANKSNYIQGGRLTPDELARELKKQGHVSSRTPPNDRVIGKTPGGDAAPGGNPDRSGSEE